VAIRDAAKKIIEADGKQELYISLQANSPQIESKHLDGAIDVLIKNNRSEVFSVGNNLMQNAAFRVFKGEYVFQQDLSTNCGVYVCELDDIHSLEDVKRIESKK
jgi:CMP-N-acetylneuraminic acid synthetase